MSTSLLLGTNSAVKKQPLVRFCCLFLSSACSCTDNNEYDFRFLQKQFNDSSLPCGGGAGRCCRRLRSSSPLKSFVKADRKQFCCCCCCWYQHQRVVLISLQWWQKSSLPSQGERSQRPLSSTTATSAMQVLCD